MRLAAAITGRLTEVLAAEQADAARAMTAGTRRAANDLKLRLRAMVVSAFGSQRLANSWRGLSFPRGGKDSLGPADLVFSRAPHIMEAFSAATTIRARDGFWLAIPTPEALQMRTANRRPTPDAVERRLGIKLRYVPRPGKSSLLVADKVRQKTGKRGGYAKASQKALREGNTTSVVMFFVVEQATLRRRFDLEAEYDRALDDMVRFIMAEWQRR